MLTFPAVHAHLQRLLARCHVPSMAAERVVVNQLRICLRLLDVDGAASDLADAIRSIGALQPQLLRSLADRVGISPVAAPFAGRPGVGVDTLLLLLSSVRWPTAWA
ncbi:hypothetical protein T484DRAFT_1840457 [Baffinella frigidus]|nr:hypothetical protein T484DRAFT_1840457 [Cryptophyta sp. CCMP2293]